MSDTLILTQAISFAAKSHQNQTRKGTDIPYIVHPTEAMAIAATMTNDIDILCAAVLHDVIEDCNVTRDALSRMFNPRIADMVASQSEKKEANAQSSWQKRKLHTINAMKNADRDTMILILSDKLSNLRCTARDFRAQGDVFWKRFNQTNPMMHHWYYASIAESLKPLENTDAYREFTELIEKVFGKR